MKHKIGIIGAGNMGSAFYRGLSKIFPADSLYIADPHIQKLTALKSKNWSTDFNQILSKADIVIMAIKPQALTGFSEELNVDLSKKLIVSIMAGVTIKKLKKTTSASKIVRSMPNLPASIGAGFTGWVCKNLGIAEKNIIRKIFQAIGTEVELKNEKLLDSLTALSGSGPAYFFYLTEIITEKARAMGFKKEVAEQIAAATFFGSAALLNRSKLPAQNLRTAVTSRGGTTEAALNCLSKNNFKNILFKAIEEAKNRARQLNK